MRFRFHEGPETATHRAIDAWWKAFTAHSSQIAALFRRENKFDLVGFMHEHLRAIDERLMWEFGPALRGGQHRLIITPERERHLRPLVDLTLARAPNNSPFEFYFGRQSEPRKLIEATVKGRTGLTIDGWKVSVKPNKRFGLEFLVVPRRDQLTDEEVVGAAMIAVESTLGETFLDVHCESIEVSSDEVDAVPLENLEAHVRTVLDSTHGDLPNAPLHEFGEFQWSLFKLEPEPAEDFPHQADLYIAKTAHVPMWQVAHMGGFSSERFSRFGETFCFVKIDWKDFSRDRVEGKHELEDSLQSALQPKALGAVISGGTGLRYSYIDLAVPNVERAVPIIRDVLRKSGVPKRSWLLFYDDALAAEWVGIWDDSPEPPGLPD